MKFARNAECLLHYIYTHLCETLVWEFYQKTDSFYKIDTSNHTELTFDASTRKASKLYDQSLSQDDAEQTNLNLQPKLCTKANRVNKHIF